MAGDRDIQISKGRNQVQGTTSHLNTLHTLRLRQRRFKFYTPALSYTRDSHTVNQHADGISRVQREIETIINETRLKLEAKCNELSQSFDNLVDSVARKKFDAYKHINLLG